MDRQIAKLHNGLQLDGKSRKLGAETVTVVLADVNGNVLHAYGATVPTDATAGYAKGAMFLKTNGGVATTIYINEGTTTSSDFNAVESSASTITGVTAGAGMTGGGTEGAVTLNVIGDEVTIAVTADQIQVKDAGISLIKLASDVAPSHVVKFAGKITWSGSGATLATAVAGVVATDIIVATIQTKPTQAAYLVGAVPTTNTVTLELSAANTGNNAVIAYTVFRAAA